MSRRNIMRRFRIDEISAVDQPCNSKCEVAIFKRASPAPEPGLAAVQTPAATDWRARREAALQALQKGAEELAKAEGLSAPAAYDAYLRTPAGASFYAQVS
jgi:hypothetical protein